MSEAASLPSIGLLFAEPDDFVLPVEAAELVFSGSEVTLVGVPASPAPLPHLGLLGGTSGVDIGSVTLDVTPAALALAGQAVSVGVLPLITTTTLPDGQLDIAYSETLTADNGPVAWAVSSGALPSWASLDASTGVLSGTPDIPDLASFSISATNSVGTAVQAYTLLVPNEVSGGGEIEVFVEVEPAALVFTPQEVSFAGTALSNTYVPVDAAELSFNGQHVDVYPGFPLEPATLTFTGQDVTTTQTVNSSIGLAVEPATLSFAGQSVVQKATLVLSEATLALTASDVTLAPKLTVQHGTLVLGKPEVDMFQQVPPGETLTVEPGELSFVGAEPAFNTAIEIEQGGLSLTPKDATMTLRFPADSGEWLHIQTTTANVWVRVETRD